MKYIIQIHVTYRPKCIVSVMNLYMVTTYLLENCKKYVYICIYILKYTNLYTIYTCIYMCMHYLDGIVN